MFCALNQAPVLSYTTALAAGAAWGSSLVVNATGDVLLDMHGFTANNLTVTAQKQARVQLTDVTFKTLSITASGQGYIYISSTQSSVVDVQAPQSNVCLSAGSISENCNAFEACRSVKLLKTAGEVTNANTQHYTIFSTQATVSVNVHDPAVWTSYQVASTTGASFTPETTFNHMEMANLTNLWNTSRYTASCTLD